MTTSEPTPLVLASTPSITTPAAPSAPAGQSAATNAPQVTPDRPASALNTATPPATAGNELPAGPSGSNWARRLRPRLPLVGLSMDVPSIAEQRVGEKDLLVEASVKVTGCDGVIIHIPVHTVLSGTLSAGFLPLAQQQLESIIEHQLVLPVKVGLATYLEDVKSARGIAGRKGSPL